MNQLFVCLLLALLFIGCDKGATPLGTPPCVNEGIDRILAQNPENPRAQVHRYNYEGKTLFYVPAPCCDIAGVVYDKQCGTFCNTAVYLAASTCEDFFREATNKTLIWEDPR